MEYEDARSSAAMFEGRTFDYCNTYHYWRWHPQLNSHLSLLDREKSTMVDFSVEKRKVRIKLGMPLSVVISLKF